MTTVNLCPECSEPMPEHMPGGRSAECTFRNIDAYVETEMVKREDVEALAFYFDSKQGEANGYAEGLQRKGDFESKEYWSAFSEAKTYQIAAIQVRRRFGLEGAE